jgi:hypothetical protein
VHQKTLDCGQGLQNSRAVLGFVRGYVIANRGSTAGIRHLRPVCPHVVHRKTRRGRPVAQAWSFLMKDGAALNEQTIGVSAKRRKTRK